jgi:hypothetical protein
MPKVLQKTCMGIILKVKVSRSLCYLMWVSLLLTTSQVAASSRDKGMFSLQLSELNRM